VSQRSKGVWLVQVSNGRDPVTGKARRVSRVVPGLKRDAIAEEARLLLQVKAGRHRDGSHTFGELVEKWFTTMAPDWSPPTVREHRRIINTKLVGLSAVRLDKISPASLDDLYGRLRVAGGKGGAPLEIASVRRIHVVVRASLEQGVRWGWLEHNPAQRAFVGKRPQPSKASVAKAKKRVPSGSAVVAFLQAAWREDPVLATQVTLDGHTGMRRGELLALRWSDLEKESAKLSVERTIVIGATTGLEEKLSTKDEKDRRLPLRAETMAILTAHRRRCLERALAAGKPLPDDAFVFSPEPDGSKPYWPSSLSRSVRLLCEHHGIEKVTLQQVRRFVSSAMYRARVDAVTEQAALGHSPLVAQLDYAETDQAAQERALQVVLDALRAAGGLEDMGPARGDSQAL